MASKQILVPIIDPGTMQMSVQDQVIEPQTWISDVLVPLTQNILGGIAFGTLGFIWFVARWEWRGAAWSAHDALLWCVLAGGGVSDDNPQVFQR
jgi:hypothetical protein